ncbi:hypothetical protein VMUT_0047 [Vulcanisaeta moutnovskia 768-28]|uniref:Uncharacterized protein n=2 Tax=Vulcanisaeta TaxID=164450 RepID=F0QYY3_VULM7|nr:hypothetical protein VMUT_0047 [Vulcanisaeta moutnovskia 768-28]
MWFLIGYLLPLKMNASLSVTIGLQLFFGLFFILAIYSLYRDIKRRGKFIKDFALYRDYAWFLTKNDKEVTIPIGEFNPCVVDYAPPVRSYSPQWGSLYFPGKVWIRINHYGEDYILLIDTEQCRRLNQILNTDFGKPRIDWCGGRVVKDMGKLGRIERPGLAC